MEPPNTRLTEPGTRLYETGTRLCERARAWSRSVARVKKSRQSDVARLVADPASGDPANTMNTCPRPLPPRARRACARRRVREGADREAATPLRGGRPPTPVSRLGEGGSGSEGEWGRRQRGRVGADQQVVDDVGDAGELGGLPVRRPHAQPARHRAGTVGPPWRSRRPRSRRECVLGARRSYPRLQPVALLTGARASTDARTGAGVCRRCCVEGQAPGSLVCGCRERVGGEQGSGCRGRGGTPLPGCRPLPGYRGKGCRGRGARSWRRARAWV